MTPAAASDERIAATRLMRRVLSQWRLVAICAVLAAIAGFVASASRSKLYEATTTVQLTDVNLATLFTSQNLQQQGIDAQTKAATNVKLVTLPRVRVAAARMLDGRVGTAVPREVISVAAQSGTTLLDISARDPDPALAASIANAIRSAFIETQQDTATAQLAATRRRVRDQLESLPPTQRGGQAGDDLRYRLNQIDNLELGTGAGVATVQVASTPTAPVSPRPKRDAILALLIGGILGIGVAVLRARLDDRIRDQSELAEHWELPVLGMIPPSRALAKEGRELASGAAMEAFALARTNLRYLHTDGQSGGPVVVTSSIAGEGKSTVAWNLALAAAMAGSRVLLIDADLRRPVLAQRLGVAAQRGFSEVLAGMVSPSDVIKRVLVSVPGNGDVSVDLIPAGFAPPSPIALLERDTTKPILDRLAARYDLVLVDTPPATVVADAKVLIERSSGAIVVSRLGVVTGNAFERLRDLLATSGSPVLGTIVNDASAVGHGYESYYGAAPAGSQEPARPAPAPRAQSIAPDDAPASSAAVAPSRN
ncbi:MAG: polysaccharide biosynthesis tyrosine autokinase [Solirubrobacteraceae bacterium]|nr:polysaccharide biosynthesis tyrosine autokinase [Solirubrobacteraceae bacterium]